MCIAYPQISFSTSSSKSKTTAITHPSYFHHLTQLLHHHNSHITRSISFYRPPQLSSPSLHPQHPSTLSSSSHLLQATHINHPLSQFFTHFSSLSSHTTHITHPNGHSKTPIRPTVILPAMPACSRL